MPTIYRPKREPYRKPSKRNYEIYNGQAWRKRSKQYRTDNPWCAMCLAKGISTPAVMTDHIHPINKGGSPFPDDDGLQSLCKSCEGKKNRLDRG